MNKVTKNAELVNTLYIKMEENFQIVASFLTLALNLISKLLKRYGIIRSIGIGFRLFITVVYLIAD